MKKVFLLVALSPIFLISCGSGEDQQKQVCECSKVYDEHYALMEKYEEEMTPGEAMDKLKEDKDLQKKLSDCEEGIHKEVGDEKFYEMSQKCD